jgi:hypothetical protein
MHLTPRSNNIPPDETCQVWVRAACADTGLSFGDVHLRLCSGFRRTPEQLLAGAISPKKAGKALITLVYSVTLTAE